MPPARGVSINLTPLAPLGKLVELGERVGLLGPFLGLRLAELLRLARLRPLLGADPLKQPCRRAPGAVAGGLADRGDQVGLGLGAGLGDLALKLVAEAYGAWTEKSMYGKKYMGVQRSTFVIDPDGKIARVFPKVQPKKHDDLVLGALSELAA